MKPKSWIETRDWLNKLKFEYFRIMYVWFFFSIYHKIGGAEWYQQPK